MDNQSITHTRWNCTYHIVFIPKYRRKIMYGETKRDLVEIIKKLCEMKQVALIDGRVCKDHIHMYVAIPPKMSVSEFMSYLKGKSTLMLFDRHPEYRTKWSDRHFWARGYYVSTVGANSHFPRPAGPHFPASQGHIKRSALEIGRARGAPPC